MVCPLPSPLSKIKGIPRNANIRGAGLSEVLSSMSDEKIISWMVSKATYDVAKGTPVEEVLNKNVADLRSFAVKLGPSWRWKAFKTLPINLENQTEFLKDCTVKKTAIRRLLELILASAFPPELLGKGNTEILKEWMVETVFDCRVPQKYPAMKILDSTPLRAMRSASFCKSTSKLYPSIQIIQKASLQYIAHFVTEITLSLMIQFVQVMNPRFSSGTRVFYSKRGFNFWRKKEMRLFKGDYLLSKVDDRTRPQKHLISNTRIVPSVSSMRPICPFSKSENWDYANKMQMINAALDYHLQCIKGHRLIGMHSEIRTLKQYLSKQRTEHPNKRLFFIKSDVSKCFANLDWKILKELLLDLIEIRKAVIAWVVTKGNTGRYFRLMGAGATQDEARNRLEAKIRRKKLPGLHTGHIRYEVFQPRLIEEIMTCIAELRFTVGSNKNQLYKMGKGVPQGCMLSSRLAHIYLAAYDRTVLAAHVINGSRMFRYADDYLFVLESKESAVAILDELQRPLNHFGIRFKKEKTLTSFNTPGYVRKGRVIVWCGAQIDTKKNTILAKPRRKATSLLLRQHTIARLSDTQRVKYRRMWREFERKTALC